MGSGNPTGGAAPFPIDPASRAIGPAERAIGPAERMTNRPDPFADLEGESNLFELNIQLVNAKTPEERGEAFRKLERWAAYYADPAHRGEIYDIMTDLVLPFMQDQLKHAQIQNIRMNNPPRREDYIGGRLGRLEIVGDTYREDYVPEQPEQPGAGAGSYASHELTRIVTGTIRIMAYDSHDAVLTSGRTWSETNGVAESVDWFGIEDLVLWPKLLLDLGKFSIRALPKVVRFGGRATFEAGKLLYSGGKTIAKGGARIFARSNWKALLKLEQAIAELAKVTVRLGAGRAAAFEAITAAEACKRLFSQTLSSIPRLAQHWPKQLAKQYVEEIKAAIMDGVKGRKIAQEVANDLATGKLSQELLKKLPENLQKKVKDLVEVKWDTIRKAFWRNVVDDVELRAELEKMGMKFGARGTAPILKIAGKELKITLDHVARKVENPLEAFLEANLRAATSRENSVVKEALVREAKTLTGLDFDEFQALASKGQPVPKDLADALGEAIDALPTEDDLFRGLNWVNPKSPLPAAKVVR